MESWPNSEKNKKFDSVERTYIGSFYSGVTNIKK